MKFNFLCLGLVLISTQVAADLVDTIKVVKPAIVGVGLQTPMGAQKNQLQGTGFVFSNGQYIATNYHVVSEPLDAEVVQRRVVFSGSGTQQEVHNAEMVGFDPVHDLAILKISQTLPSMRLAGDAFIDEGQKIAFTGFPIGAVLGLYPATHRGILAAITPDVIPAIRSTQLSANMLDRLQQRFLIYQLDATAYPGNSGSPMYLPNTGEVVGIINKVFVAESKENALEKPSGISYAIPVMHLRALAQKHQIPL